MSVSASKLRLITRIIPSTAASRIAMYGVLYLGCTFAIVSKNRPSSAIAKKTRGEASMLPFSELNDEIMTNRDTRTTPIRPKIASIVSAAISRDCATVSIGLT